MSKINDGGPAFPCEGGPTSGLRPDPGMSIRDWFAGQALVGILQSEGAYSSHDEKSKRAFAFADAMIAARNGGAA